MIILLTCAVFIFIFFYVFNQLKLQQTGIRTNAKLIGYKEESPGFGEGSTWFPILKFKNEQGKTLIHTLPEGASWKDYELNAKVPIIYDPKQPTNLVIAKVNWKNDVFLS